MSPKYEIQVLDRPNRHLPPDALTELHAALTALGALCLDPLPQYQVFSRDAVEAFDDKIVVVARHNGTLVAFVSALILDIGQLDVPVVHTGLTVIHPEHRRSFGVIQLLFAHLLVHVLNQNPRGFWITSLAEVISSLVHISKYATQVFPSPQRGSESRPGRVHMLIAREVSARYRPEMAISPDADFDEELFVFRGSNDHALGRVFMKDIDDMRHWHRDKEATEFYRGLFRRDMGDEVLQIGFIDPRRISMFLKLGGYGLQLNSDHPKL